LQPVPPGRYPTDAIPPAPLPGPAAWSCPAAHPPRPLPWKSGARGFRDHDRGPFLGLGRPAGLA